MRLDRIPAALALTGALLSQEGCERTPPPPPRPSSATELVDRLNECRTVWTCRLNPCDPNAPENAPQAFELVPAPGSTEPQIGHTAQLCEGFRAPVVCTASQYPQVSYFVWNQGLNAPYSPHLTVDTHPLAASGPSIPWTATLCSNTKTALDELRERAKKPHVPI